MTQSNSDKIHYVRIPKGHGARAEMVRLVYVLSGRPYTDVLYSFAEVRQGVGGKNPFKQLPVVETTSGQFIYQTLAIMHHAAQGTPVWPSDPQRLTDTLGVAMGGYDLYQWFGSFAADDLVAKKKFEERRAPQFFDGLNEIYGGRAFAAGDTPTFADAIVREAVAWCVRRNDVCRGLFESTKALSAFMGRFESIPAVSEFMKRQAAARQVDDSV